MFNDRHKQPIVQEVKGTLNSFLEIFNKYSKEIFGSRRRDNLDKFRIQLQQQEPKVTKYILDILVDGTVTIGSFRTWHTLSYRDLLPSALMGGKNEEKHNFYDYMAPVTNLLNRALGTIDAGLWPRKEPTPVLVIRDNELRERCSDLLNSSGNYDRVIREATTVLEDQIRRKPSHTTLARLIPQATDQTGENLVNKLLSPGNPVLVVSNERHKQVAFHRIMLGVFSYLRNPYHHKLDPLTEWSWAWATVGLIDRLLAEVESCSVAE